MRLTGRQAFTAEGERSVAPRSHVWGKAFLPDRERVQPAGGDAGGDLAEGERVEVLRALVEQQRADDRDEAVDWRENGRERQHNDARDAAEHGLDAGSAIGCVSTIEGAKQGLDCTDVPDPLLILPPPSVFAESTASPLLYTPRSAPLRGKWRHRPS